SRRDVRVRLPAGGLLQPARQQPHPGPGRPDAPAAGAPEDPTRPRRDDLLRPARAGAVRGGRPGVQRPRGSTARAAASAAGQTACRREPGNAGGREPVRADPRPRGAVNGAARTGNPGAGSQTRGRAAEVPDLLGVVVRAALPRLAVRDRGGSIMPPSARPRAAMMDLPQIYAPVRGDLATLERLLQDALSQD